jgi:hypothetical protein
MVRFTLTHQYSLTKDRIEHDPLKTGTTKGDQMFHAGSALAFPIQSDDEDTEMQVVEKDDTDEDEEMNEDGDGNKNAKGSIDDDSDSPDESGRDTDKSVMGEAVANTTFQDAHDDDDEDSV